MRRALTIGVVAVVAVVLADDGTREATPTVERSLELSGGAPPGKVNLVRNATSNFDGFLVDGSPAERRAIEKRFWRIRGYDPFFADSGALGWAPPAHVYQDLYAIYRDLPEYRALRRKHPNWVLRDVGGRDLFIPADCNGTTCTQYAADVGNPAFRSWWIHNARRILERGYEGLFIDDVNLTITVSDGAGDPATPIDPRTGSRMTVRDWRAAMADFAEEIAEAFPAAEIVHNIQWHNDPRDPAVLRQFASADMVELERGFSDPGLTGDGGPLAFDRFLGLVDTVHDLGRSVMYEPYGLNPQLQELELAGYHLMRDQEDAIVSDYAVDPGDLSTRWSADLGAPLTDRSRWRGLWRRDYVNGIVLVNPPDSPPVRVDIPDTSRLNGTRGGFVLGPRSGAVLLREEPLRGPHQAPGSHLFRALDRLLP